MQFLPQFPLQLVVYPGESLNLHIFEPRYKQLIRECTESGQPFGIPPFQNKKVMDIGTEIEILEITKTYPNGQMDIRTHGSGLYRIHEFQPQAEGKLYAGAMVSAIPIEFSGTAAIYRELHARIRILYRELDIQKDLPEDPSAWKVFDVAHHVGFSQEQEYELLTLQTEQERQLYLRDHLNKLLPIVRETEALKRKAKMNGHFRNIQPPDLGF